MRSPSPICGRSPSHPAVADVDVAAVDVDVHVAAIDSDVAAIPIDVVVAVPAIPVVVIEDLVEDDGAAKDDAACHERVVPVVVIVIDVTVAVAAVSVVIDGRAYDRGGVDHRAVVGGHVDDAWTGRGDDDVVVHFLDEIFDDDDWDGWDSDDDIDWDRGDITIDRGDVDIDVDRGDINIGNGDRPQIGDGDRISIGDTDRTPGRPWRSRQHGIARVIGRVLRIVPANRTSISNAASRDVARQKIEARKSTRAGPREPGNVATCRLSSAGVWLARPDAIAVDDKVSANDLAPQDQPHPDGESAEPFERLPATVALAAFGVQQPRPSERRPRRWRPGWRWWTGWRWWWWWWAEALR